MFTLGYLPIIAIFIYILVILGIKCITFSLFKYQGIDFKENYNKKVINKKETNKVK